MAGYREIFWCRTALAMTALAPLMLPAASAAAQTQNEIAFDIPAGRLGAALSTLSKQANVTVVGQSRDLSKIRTPAVRGRYTSVHALHLLLRNTSYFARRINPRTFRIEKRLAPPRPDSPTQRKRTPLPLASPRPAPPELIIVSATKRNLRLQDYPGAAQSISLNGLTAGQLGDGLDQLLSKIPVTSGTALGTGRNKLFIRGIADSSFNGPTQSTIGIYLGEQRLIYSASNPDLRLYDMDSIELLEGPQGTLYGAGAIGGVIRMTPNVPRFDETAAAIWTSGMITGGGSPSYDVAAMANLPLTESEAVRGLIYKGQSGGYIDDRLRNLQDINRTRVDGGRLAFRSEFSPDWTLDITGFGQMTEARDGQYVDAQLSGLTQETPVGQRFDSEILGLNLVVNGVVGDVRILSTTGLIDHQLQTRFDATVLAGPGSNQLYDETRKIKLFDHETRVSRENGSGLSWLVGASALVHEDDIEQQLVNLDGQNPPPLVNIVYKVHEYALFGEASYPLQPGFSATLGGRLTYTKGEASRTFGASIPVEPDTDSLRFLPVAGLSLRLSDEVSTYLRYQHGFRSGGITVERTDQGDPQIARFNADRVRSIEAGMKGNLNSNRPIEFKLAGFYLKWKDIQADLIEPSGFAITRNIGDAKIFGLTMQSATALTPELQLRNSFFLNYSKIMRSTPNVAAISSMLPNIAPFGARLALQYTHPLANGSHLVGTAGLDYSGRSVLDIGPTEQVRQGNFASADLSLVWQNPSWQVGLEANNITDTRGNRFSFGNPFTIRRESQQVPLRPFSVRISAKLEL